MSICARWALSSINSRRGGTSGPIRVSSSFLLLHVTVHVVQNCLCDYPCPSSSFLSCVPVTVSAELLVDCVIIPVLYCVITPVLPCPSCCHITVIVCVVQNCLLVVWLSLSFIDCVIIPVLYCVIIPVLPHLSCCHPFCFTQYYVTNVLVLPQHKRVSCARWQPFLQDRWLSHHNSQTPDVSWFF